jgi:hypothetical protein
MRSTPDEGHAFLSLLCFPGRCTVTTRPLGARPGTPTNCRRTMRQRAMEVDQVVSPRGLTSEERADLAKLRRDNKQFEQENAFPKKAPALGCPRRRTAAISKRDRSPLALACSPGLRIRGERSRARPPRVRPSTPPPQSFPRTHPLDAQLSVARARRRGYGRC